MTPAGVGSTCSTSRRRCFRGAAATIAMRSSLVMPARIARRRAGAASIPRQRRNWRKAQCFRGVDTERWVEPYSSGRSARTPAATLESDDMAHNIASINGQNAIAYIGSTPWHGLGTRLRGDVRYSVEQFLAAAGLDWDVAAEPIFNAEGQRLHKGQVVRRLTDNRELAIVGPAYTVVQNREAASIFDIAINEFGASIEVAGALGD